MKSSFSIIFALFLFLGLLIVPQNCEDAKRQDTKSSDVLINENTTGTSGTISTLKPNNLTTSEPDTSTAKSTKAPDTDPTTTTVSPDTTPTTTTTTKAPDTTPTTTTTKAPDTTTTKKPTTTSVAPETTTTKTTTTVAPDTTSAAPSTTTIAPSTTPKPGPVTPCGHFDGPSFIGGIILTLGLLAIGLVAYKFYKARNERNYHTL